MDDCPEDVAQCSDRLVPQPPLLYSVDDKPPWILSIFLGIQHYLTTVGGVISVPFILGPALCILGNDPAMGYLISTIFMVSGISTILQCTLGVRLPIIQGSSFAFISCILAFLNLPEWECPSNIDLYSMGSENRTEEWQGRMQVIQGAVISMSFIEMFLGYSGLIGLLLRYISPLTIAPTITLVGLSMVSVATKMASGNWYIALATILTVFIFSQLLRTIHTPVLWYTFSKGWHFTWILGFQLFPVLLATYIICTVCYILTTYNVLSDENPGRTDLRLDALTLVEWFRVPYPFQWGWPRFTINSVLAVMAAVTVGIVESIGDYYACASICGKPPPPLAALNRGIGAEGVGCLIAGVFGIGPGVTSFSENIGAIGVTKVGSRRVIICGALFMIFLSVFGKVGALFALIPTPVVGGLLCVMFSMVTAVGLSNLQHVNLKSHRNMFVLGSAMFFGIAIPKSMEHNSDAYFTGNMTADGLITVLLSTHIFVTATVAFILDNLIPGTTEERGVITWLKGEGGVVPLRSYNSTYQLPELFNLNIFKKTGHYIGSFK